MEGKIDEARGVSRHCRQASASLPVKHVRLSKAFQAHRAWHLSHKILEL